MKQHLILIPVISLLLSFTWKQEDEGVISWDEHKPLSWNDYKGTAPKNAGDAYTHYSILKSVAKSVGNLASVKIQTVVFSQTSWKKKKSPGTTLLAHEQKHFDIAELYARKLRKLVSEQTCHSMAMLHKKTDSLYTEIDTALHAYQTLYEAQTNGKANRTNQPQWDVSISTELHALDSYSVPVFAVTLK